MLGWSFIMFSAWFERKPERGREGRSLFLATQIVEENRDELWDGVMVTAGDETTASGCWTHTSHDDQLLSSLSMESCFWCATMQDRRSEHQNSISCSVFGSRITFRVWAALHVCCSIYWSGVLSVEAMINKLQTGRWEMVQDRFVIHLHCCCIKCCDCIYIFYWQIHTFLLRLWRANHTLSMTSLLVWGAFKPISD